MRLVESFTSLQGESTHAGRVCFFLRLAGCNLRCNYCDTRYAQTPDCGSPATLEELVRLARESGVSLVEVTGGEPLTNPETPELCRRLLDAGFEVLLETNGSLPIEPVPYEVRKILDCKLPGSGMAEYNDYSNYTRLAPHDEVKFVVSNRADFDFMMDVVKTYDLPSHTRNLLAGPVWDRVTFQELAEWLIASRSPVRMQLQLHKLIWGNRPGV